jgi:multidrug resistance protein MdtO
VEAMLRRRAAGKAGKSHAALDAFAFNGAMEQLKLIKLSAVIEPLLKQRKLEFTAQIILMDRLVTAAAALEYLPISNTGDSEKTRLLRVADACGVWRLAIKEHRAPAISKSSSGKNDGINQHDLVPFLAEMEHVIELLPSAFNGDNLPDELKLPPAQKGGVIVPDAFTNSEYIHFAVKGALAAFICYLIFTMFAYQGIYTSVITCIVCSLSTVGASVQKGMLRFAGAIAGCLLGVIAVMYVFPHLDSLGGFWFPFTIATALASYVHFGGPRISYCGFQIAVAFYKCVLQTYGTYTELTVVRDRMVGVALGLLVFGLINSKLWPVTALETLRTKLGDALRQLANLARLPDDDKNPAPRLSEAYTLRLQAYQDFTAIREMLESSRFEPGAEECESWEATNDRAKALLLQLLAIIQHRSDLRPLDAPEPVRATAVRFRLTLADVLQNCSGRIKGRPESPLPELSAALAELEQIFALHIDGITDPARAAHLRGRLTLYQETVNTTIAMVEEIDHSLQKVAKS